MGWCVFVEANPVGSRVDELHLPAWSDTRIKERISALVEFGV
jgi:hypothetical protein